MIPPLPQVKDLVLVGGGHAHVHVLKAFAMHPVNGLRITLISREVDTPYSGMLPGHVSGTYAEPDVHINLLRLARFAGARLFIAEVTSIDSERQQVCFGDGRQLRYDLLSINTGAAPNCPFDLPFVVPVKPIGRFLSGWQRLAQRLTAGDELAVVGGGAGGFEIALAAKKQLGADIRVSLLTSDRLLPEHGDKVRALAEVALDEAGVLLVKNFRVDRIDTDQLTSAAGESRAATGVLWVTGVSAPAWLADTGLKLDEQGYIEVDTFQRSTSHAAVFAAGDVAGMRDQPRPKSGVFAVRQGPVLAKNLRLAALDRFTQARPYRAQSRYLALLNCADGTAIASYGGWAGRHSLLWRLKDYIDSAFMRKFGELPDMSSGKRRGRVDELRSDELGEDMRCGGCGSKINATLLKRVLRDLPVVDAPWVAQGIGDDAAVLHAQPGPIVLTTDGFRSMVDDTRLLGRVATHHALSDIYAMGAEPTSVMVTATIPLMSEPMMEQELRDLLQGVQSVLTEEGIPLVGGHSSEGAELAISLAATGRLEEGQPLKKTAANAGDVLVLTKGLGSGCILAAAMRGECDTVSWLDCLSQLDTSNRQAARIARNHGASACTDVTGFGLAGHLFEMLGGQVREVGELGAELYLHKVPALAGAVGVIESGVVSSLHQANAQALSAFDVDPELLRSSALQLLADPQTAGGLLFTVAPENADCCIAELHDAGYEQAAAVGRLTSGLSKIVGDNGSEAVHINQK